MPDYPTEEDVLGYFKSLSNWGRWGPKDQIGTVNHITPEKRVRAASLVKDGFTVTCARPITTAIAPDVISQPIHYMIESGEGYAYNEKAGPRRMTQSSSDFFGMAFHGNTITHLDSLCHMFYESKMYNGQPSSLVSTRLGATTESIDSLRDGIVTRGVLLDIPRLRDVQWLEPGDGVMREDLEAAERDAGLLVEAGDVLLIRTGQLRRRNELGPWDMSAEGSTGPHAGCLPFFYERSISILGSDTANSLPHPGFTQLGNPVHQVAIVAMGLWLLDNANLDDLAYACSLRNRWEFLICISPLRIEGGTGSPLNPVAVF